MKPRSSLNAQQFEAGCRDLAAVFAALDEPQACRALLEDLTTPSELEALVDRWRVARLLDQGLPYREIHERTGVSVTTIGRVARFIERGHGGYRQSLSLLAGKAAATAQGTP